MIKFTDQIPQEKLSFAYLISIPSRFDILEMVAYSDDATLEGEMQFSRHVVLSVNDRQTIGWKNLKRLHT